MFLENVRMAFRNFVSNKLRTCLSLLGIVIGVSSVILITTLGKSATADIQGEISGSGMDVIMLYGGWGKARSKKLFQPELSSRLCEEIDGLKHATALLEDSALVRSEFHQGSVALNAVEPSYREVFHIEMAAGRFLDSYDASRRSPTAVLGNQLARRLFPTGGAVGSGIKLLFDGKARQLKVVGVLKKRDSLMGTDFNNVLLTNLSYLSSRVRKVETVNSFYLQAEDSKRTIAVSEAVDSFLFRQLQDRDSYWVDSPSSLNEMYKEISNTLSMVLGGIAAISLLVGGIGIMNIMLVSVTERTREIGIRKALGARAGMIRSQFLIESASLTLIGGCIGAVGGYALGKLVTSMMEWNFVPDYRALLIALSFSVLIGVFFGIYPAIRASKLDPIEALSRE